MLVLIGFPSASAEIASGLFLFSMDFSSSYVYRNMSVFGGFSSVAVLNLSSEFMFLTWSLTISRSTSLHAPPLRLHDPKAIA